MTQRFHSDHVDNLRVEVHGIGSVLGDDVVRAPLALALVGNDTTVIEGSRDDLLDWLMQVAVEVRTFKPGPHTLEVVDENVHCTTCGITVDPDSVERINRTFNCDAQQKEAFEEHNHVWHYDDAPGSPPWYCARCAGSLNNHPCTTPHQETP